uniref:Putative secreted protein n=1 Tax=Anopheles darlingi TaxID=43151 RepID=A0A2M4D5P4_ANODA
MRLLLLLLLPLVLCPINGCDGFDVHQLESTVRPEVDRGNKGQRGAFPNPTYVLRDRCKPSRLPNGPGSGRSTGSQRESESQTMSRRVSFLIFAWISERGWQTMRGIHGCQGG